METTKIRALVLTAALVFSYTAYADEPNLTTFNNARFEPLLKAEAGEIIINRLDSFSPETRETLVRDFRVIPLPGNSFFNTYYTRGFYVIGEGGEITKYIYAEGLSDVIIPSSNGDRYLLFTGNIPMSLEGHWGTAPTRELYSADGELMWRYEYVPGYPRASGDLSLVCVLRPGGVLTQINAAGETVTIEHQGWNTPFLVSSEGDKILLNDYENGTVILDAQGRVINHLEEDYCGWGPYLIGSFPDVQSYYVSSDFIIQLCRKAEVKDHRVQVYNGEARLLWEKEFPWQEHHGLRFGISPNEEFLLICIRLPEPKCELYGTKNGAKLRKIRIEEEDLSRFVECGVTNDGRKCFVTTLDNTNLKSTTYVFEKGKMIAEFRTEAPENLTCNYPLVEFSRDGSLIAVSFEKGFTIYEINPD